MTFGLAPGELAWLAGAAFAAGLVRGFTGFGTAMIYLPLAAQVLSPINAIITLIAMDLLGPIPNLPRAWRDADRKDLGRLISGVVFGLPVGLYFLTGADPDLYRTVISVGALLLVTALILGLSYPRALSPRAVVAVGGAGGLLGGFTGMPGPPVILTYMAGPHSVAVIRSMTMLYLYTYDMMMISVLGVSGNLTLSTLFLGALMGVPNLVGNVLGAWSFRPGKEAIYRNAAYVAIAFTALSSLPIWD